MEAAVSRKVLILPHLVISMKSWNTTRVADSEEEMSSEGESVWLLLLSGLVPASGAAAVFAFACFLGLLLGAMVRW